MAGKVVKIDGYATHQSLLVKYALKAKKGDIIVEMGVGFYSTPILSEICQSLGLTYKVYYSDIPWQKEVEKIASAQYNYVSDWSKFVLDEDVHLVLLDNEELVINRVKHIEKSLKNHAKYIVCHDADTYDNRGVSLNKYTGELFDKLTPFTFVIDNTIQPIKPPKLINDSRPNGSKPNGSRHKLIKETTEEIRSAVVCCFQPGGDYDEHYLEYIEKLYKGVKDNVSFDIDFHCITIMDISSIEGVKKIEPLKKDWSGWHIKAEIFRSDLWKNYDRILYIDLDTQIVDNIDNILKNKKNLVMLRDFYSPNVWETGLIYFNPEEFEGIYNEYVNARPRIYIKDADIISSFVRKKNIQPDFFQDNFKVGSYKLNLVRDGRGPQEYQIICYHGHPRPHEINWDLSFKRALCGPLSQLNPIKENIITDCLVKRPGPMGGYHVPVSKLRQVKDVEEIWKDKDVFVIGGGPSLKRIDLDKLLVDEKVLGINDGYKFDCCDICFFGDVVWYNHHKDDLHKWGKPIFSTAGLYDEKIHFLNIKGIGLSENKGIVGWNSNSGFAGMNLALHLGAKNVFLLGFDMDFDPKTKESNWHNNIRVVNSTSYDCFLKNEKKIASDLKFYFPDRNVFNCITPNYDSRISVFPKIKLEELFNIDATALYKDIDLLKLFGVNLYNYQDKGVNI